MCYHAGCLRMYRPALYNLCVCVCVCVCVYQCDSLPTQQKRGVTEGLPSRWQTVWSSKIGIFSLTGCQSASLFFFPPLCSTSLHLSLSLSLFSLHLFSMKWERMGSCQHEQRWRYCQRELSIVAVCRAGLLLSGCHRGAAMRCGKLRRICRGGNKAWHPTDLTPLSSWYQSPHTQTSQSTGLNISDTQKINIKYIKGCPSTSPYEINMT